MTERLEELMEQARDRFAAGDLESALESCRQIRSVALESGTSEQIANADSMAATCHWHRGEFDECLAANLRAASAFRDLGFAENAETADLSAGMCLRTLERYSDAKAVFQHLLDSPRTSVQSSALLSHYVGESLYHESDYPAAIAHFRQARDLYNRVDSPNDVADAEHWLGNTYLATEDFRSAATMFKAAGDRYSPDRKEPPANAEWILANRVCENGELEFAVELYRSASAHLGATGPVEITAHLHIRAAETLIRLGRERPNEAEKYDSSAYEEFCSAASAYGSLDPENARIQHLNAAARALEHQWIERFYRAISKASGGNSARSVIQEYNIRAAGREILEGDRRGAARLAEDGLAHLVNEGLVDLDSTNDLDVFDMGTLGTLLTWRVSADGRTEAARLRDGRAALGLFLRQIASYQHAGNHDAGAAALTDIKWLFWIMGQYTNSGRALLKAKEELIDELKGQFEDTIIDALPDSVADVAQAGLDGYGFASDVADYFGV